MKPAFKSAKRLGKKLSLVFLGCLLAAPFAAVAQIMGTYNSPSVVNSPPMVDATNFVNTGVWNINTGSLPYTTFYTRNYTNTGGGSMTGSVGWEFDQGPLSNGGRGWSTSFFNDNNCTVSASDATFASGISYTISYLLVSATNIVNKGSLSSGPNGEIILNGSQVTLDRSLLDITPVVGIGGGSSNGSTNFVADNAIYDEYWSLSVSNVLTVSGSPWNGTSLAIFTGNNVGEPCGTTGTVQIGESFKPQVADSYSNSVEPYQLTLTNSTGGLNTVTVFSNMVRQAVFVFVNTNANANITATNHFTPNLNPTNFFRVVAVQFDIPFTNFVTLTLQTNTLYLVDYLAASTNRVLVTNSFIHFSAPCTTPTERPDTVVVSRTDPNGNVWVGPAFASGFPGMGSPSPTFFYDPLTFSNFVATGICDIYSALVDDLANEPRFGFGITNAPGKIYVYANSLSLNKTRMSALSQIVIQASNSISGIGAVMDCQNLSYNLGSTNGLLNVTNLAAPSVKRLHGTIDEWSGLWTNYIVTVYQNYMQVITSTSTNYVLSPLTNTTEVDLSITVVDATGLSSTVPQTVQDLVLRSTNIVVSDSMVVTNTLLLNGQSFTLFGNLTLSNGIQNWGAAIAPTLRYFTNYGTLTIPNNAHFGDDGPTNYAVFVNQGTIKAGGQTINSDYLEINGATNVATSAGFTATCKTGLVMNASIIAAGDIQFFANNLLIDPSILSSGGAIDFTVTNSLSDTGFANGNIFTCSNGFNLFIKPATGDLLGTTITNIAVGEDEVDNVWAGHDFGNTSTGYTNNVSIGKLVLLPQGSSLLEPLFYFKGATSGNGMYVSNLDLTALTDFTNEIDIDSSLNIYFASAEVNPALGLGHPAAEQLLDGHVFPSGGSLHWVQGVTTLVKQPIISGGMIPGGKYKMNISGSSGQTNIIQASTNLVNWISIYTNVGSSPYIDPKATNYPFRFYRIMTMP
jgi:hypothetical protein